MTSTDRAMCFLAAVAIVVGSYQAAKDKFYGTSQEILTIKRKNGFTVPPRTIETVIGQTCQGVVRTYLANENIGVSEQTSDLYNQIQVGQTYAVVVFGSPIFSFESPKIKRVIGIAACPN